MQPDPLIETEAALRAALSTGSWGEAQKLVSAYCAQVEERLRALPGNGPEARRLSGYVKHLLRWSHNMALTGRAHLAEQISELPSLSGYATRAPSDRRQTWLLEA